MKIAYGPPGAVGVKSLQYVSGGDGIGDDADYVSTNLHLVAKPLGVLALGTWAYAWRTKKPKLKKQAMAVAIGAFVVQVLTRPR